MENTWNMIVPCESIDSYLCILLGKRTRTVHVLVHVLYGRIMHLMFNGYLSRNESIGCMDSLKSIILDTKHLLV